MPDRLDLYRPNVGIVLFNREGLVWMGHRNSGSPHQGQEYSAAISNPWQFPQGGVDEGEALEAAARRELAEETGVISISLLGHTEDWFAYDFPPHVQKGGKWLGQKQVWYAFRFEGEESEIRLDQHDTEEFNSWRWERLENAPGLIVPFKRQSYERVVETFHRFAAV